MIVFPNSKINIGLNIVRKRPDGYHDIQTMMMPIGWGDVLEVVPSTSGRTTLAVTGRHINCPMEKNLVVKALRRVEMAVGQLPPVDIYLRKIVPDGAGLGGGSADAAYMVRLLDSMFELGLGDERMAALCAEIGADCPFFIVNGPMLAKGTGTQLEPIELPQLAGMRIVVVKPPVGVSTAEAYAGVSPTGCVLDMHRMAKLPVKEWRDTLYNSFEPSVLAKLPRVSEIKDRLYELGAVYASMSGSGSAVYGLFEGDILADALQAEFEDSAVWSGTL